MDDLHQDSHAHTGLPVEYFALCSEHFKASCFSRSVFIRTLVDFKRFYLEKGSVLSIYTNPKDSLNIDYSRNEGRLANRFFPEKRSLDIFETLLRNVSIQNSPPLPKKLIPFLDWVGLFEICFRSSEMTDPRPCPREWVYFRVPSCSTETCQVQTNNKLSAAKIDIFRGQRNITRKTPPPNKRLSVMTNDLITFCQVRSRFGAEGLTLPCSQSVLPERTTEKLLVLKKNLPDIHTDFFRTSSFKDR